MTERLNSTQQTTLGNVLKCKSGPNKFWGCQDQGPTGRGFQLQDGSGSGIRKNISGRIGYGSGTGIFIMYLNNRVLSGSENLDRVFFGYLFHGT